MGIPTLCQSFAVGGVMEGTPFGRYRLQQLLGSGGMGEVWRAYDTGTDRVVAIKVLHSSFAKDHTFEQRFRREAHAAAGLSNQHIIPIHDFGEIDGRLFVDMRLIDGRDLGSVLAEGRLEPTRAVRIIDQVAKALHAAHRVGLVHRDVKPSNILLAEDDFAYLIDFGIARAASDTALTSVGTTIGTWAYMAPERFRTGEIDARADVYALACVLYECVTGARPYPGDTLERLVAGHMFTPPPKPSAIGAGLPATLDRVIAFGLAKDPNYRYASSMDLARAAYGAVTGPGPMPVQTQQPAPPPAAPPRDVRVETPRQPPFRPALPTQWPVGAFPSPVSAPPKPPRPRWWRKRARPAAEWAPQMLQSYPRQDHIVTEQHSRVVTPPPVHVTPPPSPVTPPPSPPVVTPPPVHVTPSPITPPPAAEPPAAPPPLASPPTTQRSRWPRKRILVPLVVVAVVIAGASPAIAGYLTTTDSQPIQVDAPNAAVLDVPAVAAARSSVVKVRSEAPSCQRAIEGSGFVVAPNRVMSTAYVVAGAETVIVVHEGRDYRATVISFDPDVGIAILAVPDLPASPLQFDVQHAQTGADAAVLGYPGDGAFSSTPARIREVIELEGPGIVPGSTIAREVYTIRGSVPSGTGGGPLVDRDGKVLGVVSGAAANDPDAGFALTAGAVAVQMKNVADTAPVATGACSADGGAAVQTMTPHPQGS